MNAKPLSFFSRLGLAVSSFFAIAGDARLAGEVARLREGVPAGAKSDKHETEDAGHQRAQQAPGVQAPTSGQNATAAYQLLGLLQREARFVDFVQEDVAAYDDAEIGAAARVVHEGCRKVLREHMTLVPVREEAEGSRITLPAGFDAGSTRVTGNVLGAPPFTGTLAHRGWRVSDARLPQLADPEVARVIAQAEVEL